MPLGKGSYAAETDPEGAQLGNKYSCKGDPCSPPSGLWQEQAHSTHCVMTYTILWGNSLVKLEMCMPCDPALHSSVCILKKCIPACTGINARCSTVTAPNCPRLTSSSVTEHTSKLFYIHKVE